jgi:putative tryptophan/tyrosine transport system substrate-binding protein
VVRLGDGMIMRASTLAWVLENLAPLVLASLLVVSATLGDAAANPAPKVGAIWSGSSESHRSHDQAFRSGMHDLGYVDGQNVILVSRFAEGDPSKAAAQVDELLALNVNVLFVSASPAHIAKKKTATVPIVSALFFDPVAEGLVASLAHPGGNITGISWQAPEVSAKRLELLLEVNPGFKRVAALVDMSDRGASVDAEAIRLAASRLGLKLRVFEIHRSEDLADTLGLIAKSRPQALIVSWTGLTDLHQKRIAKFASSHRIPWVSEPTHFAYAGALLTYGPNLVETIKRGTVYVDKILKGAKPADLPIEQPTRFLLVVNLKSAKVLRIQLPESILLRADEVIR